MSCILALDSSTDACSVALIRDSEVITLFELAARSHTQRLLPMVDDVMHQSACSLGDVDAIAFGCGPGSFTGLRICLGVVQGLAFGLQIPVIPVSTLMAMAAGHFRLQAAKDNVPEVLVALDARMQEVYWGLFRKTSSDTLVEAITEEFVMSPKKVATHADVQIRAAQMIGIGQGWHYPELQQLPTLGRDLNVYPRAEDIARLAELSYRRGETLSVFDAQPVYLRDEVSWQKRQRIRAGSLPNV